VQSSGWRGNFKRGLMEAEAKPPFREVIWHFLCSQCKLWWSFATDDNWKPKEWYCPHCGHKKKHEEE